MMKIINKILGIFGLCVVHYSFKIDNYVSGTVRIRGVFPSFGYRGDGGYSGYAIARKTRRPYIDGDKIGG